ncbi:MAG: hypothetical protein HYZ14_04055 [Bacteroidetes bacterium]|nr:hypothetical protein [Bacteroidota bacterium]
MKEAKRPIIILIISIISVLVIDTINYYEFKKIESIGEYSTIYRVYNSLTDNYDYYFKTKKGETITVFKSFNSKKNPDLSSRQVIYDPKKPVDFKYTPYRNSWLAMVTKTCLIGMVLSIIIAITGVFLRLFNKKKDEFDNWEKYKNSDINYKGFRWIIKKHPVFNFFVLNQLITLFYVFGFCAILTSFGFSSFNIIAVLIFTISLIGIITSILMNLKFVLVNGDRIEIHFWVLPRKRKIIEFENLKTLSLIEKRDRFVINYSLVDNDKKIRLNLPFSDNEIKDLHSMMNELKENTGANIA